MRYVKFCLENLKEKYLVCVDGRMFLKNMLKQYVVVYIYPAVNRPVALRADNLFVLLVQKRFALKSYLILGLSKDNKYFILKVLNFRKS